MMELNRKETTKNCTLRAARTLFNFLVKESYMLRSPMANMTLVMLFIETGVRVRELCDIKLTDIVWEDGAIKTDGKGYKQRLVPIQVTMKKQLQKYVKLRGELDTDSFFVSIDNRPIKIRSVQEQMAAYGKTANITGVRCSPHTARHTFAKMSVQNGADVFALQAVLGHAGLEMTRVYVNMFSGEVNAQHRKFSPLEGLQ